MCDDPRAHARLAARLQTEMPIPEQFKTVYDRKLNKLVTQMTDIAG